MSEGPEAFVISVSRLVHAPAARIFRILADPGRHPDFDGSGMLRPGTTSLPISAVDDTFEMFMNAVGFGDYRTVNYVVEFEQDRVIGWAPSPLDEEAAAAAGVTMGTALGHRWVYRLEPRGDDATLVTESYDCSRAGQPVKTRVQNGRGWVKAVTKSLDRLDALCASPV